MQYIIGYSQLQVLVVLQDKPTLDRNYQDPETTKSKQWAGLLKDTIIVPFFTIGNLTGASPGPSWINQLKLPVWMVTCVSSRMASCGSSRMTTRPIMPIMFMTTCTQ